MFYKFIASSVFIDLDKMIIADVDVVYLGDISDTFLDFAVKNSHKLMQPEQDTINLICYPKIKTLPLNTVACSYVYAMYKTEKNYEKDCTYTPEEIKVAMKNPIQIHYAVSVKPWMDLSSCKSDEWIKVLVPPPFFLQDFLDSQKKEPKIKSKKVFSFKIPYTKRVISIIKEKL